MAQMTERQKELLHKAGKHYAATYLLMTIAVDHADMGDKAVEELGMYRNEIKQNAARVQKSFDRFCQDFKKYIAHGDEKVVLNDWEQRRYEIAKDALCAYLSVDDSIFRSTDYEAISKQSICFADELIKQLKGE